MQSKFPILTTQWNVTQLPSNRFVHCVTPWTWLFAASISAIVFGILNLWKHFWWLNMRMGFLWVPFLARNSRFRYIHLSHIIAAVSHTAIVYFKKKHKKSTDWRWNWKKNCCASFWSWIEGIELTCDVFLIHFGQTDPRACRCFGWTIVSRQRFAIGKSKMASSFKRHTAITFFFE